MILLSNWHIIWFMWHMFLVCLSLSIVCLQIHYGYKRNCVLLIVSYNYIKKSKLISSEIYILCVFHQQKLNKKNDINYITKIWEIWSFWWNWFKLHEMTALLNIWDQSQGHDIILSWKSKHGHIDNVCRN